MNTDQQIKQLKEAIRSSELMIIEQSKIIVNLNIELDDTKNKLTTTVSDCQNKINVSSLHISAYIFSKFCAFCSSNTLLKQMISTY